MMATGIRQRHGRACDGQGRCKCPWEAAVYSRRDSKKIRRQFPTRAAAVAWRDDARSALSVVPRGTAPPDQSQIAAQLAELLETQREILGLLRGQIRRRARIPNATRNAVFERDNWTCQHCGGTENLTIDHIESWLLGGSDKIGNLQTLCASCNAAKG